MTASILFVNAPPAADASALDSLERMRQLAALLGVGDFLPHIPCLHSVDAGVIMEAVDIGDTVVALRRSVSEALGMPRAVPDRSMNWLPRAGETWQRDGVRFIFVTVSCAAEVCGDMRAMLMPELVLGAPGLRPWHFRLDDPATLADLSAAVSPRCPALGAAALTWAAERHVARIARDSTPLLAAMSQAFGGARFATGPNPWDEPLVNLARDLLQHDGGRVLGERWDPEGSAKRGGPGWLVARAAQHADLNNYPRAHIRATMQRYAMAGLT